jgi:tRNA(Ile2) C34 agmatinyltransferase TiaS
MTARPTPNCWSCDNPMQVLTEYPYGFICKKCQVAQQYDETHMVPSAQPGSAIGAESPNCVCGDKMRMNGAWFVCESCNSATACGG